MKNLTKFFRGGIIIKKEIPFLSVNNDINRVEDYERFKNTKAYLKKKAGRVKSYFQDEKKKIKDLADKCGYKNFNKFVEHRKEWVDLKRKIPIRFLEAIGVKIDALKYTVELDRKAYEEALELNLYPEKFLINLSPIPVSKDLPVGVSEEEAVEILKKYADKYKKLCLIKYPEIKTVAVKPGGEVFEEKYHPKLEINNKFVIPHTSNEKVGKVYLK